MISLVKGLRASLDILLPRKCIVCHKTLLLDEEYICLNCMADLPETYFWKQSHNPMADKLNEILQEEECSMSEKYAYATSLFFYHSEAGYRQIPYQIKYHGNIRAGSHFGKMLGKRLASSDLYKDVDMVVPIPLHRTRKWKRGYNQAEVIARGVAESMGVCLRKDILKRVKKTATQTEMSIEEKAANVADAFTVSDKKEAWEGCRHVLLIDDVFTTGNTSGACYKALRQIFPKTVRISVATLGFVGH